MSIEELLKRNRDEVSYEDVISVINEVGLSNVTKEDLERIMNRFGVGMILHNNLHQIYIMKSNEHSNKVIRNWTVAVGIFTIFNVVIVAWQFFS